MNVKRLLDSLLAVSTVGLYSHHFQEPSMSTYKRLLSRIIAAFFVSVFMLFCMAGCQGDKNQVPELQGKDSAIDVRETVVGFGLVSASRSKNEDEVALLLQL